MPERGARLPGTSTYVCQRLPQKHKRKLSFSKRVAGTPARDDQNHAVSGESTTMAAPWPFLFEGLSWQLQATTSGHTSKSTHPDMFMHVQQLVHAFFLAGRGDGLHVPT